MGGLRRDTWCSGNHHRADHRRPLASGDDPFPAMEASPMSKEQAIAEALERFGKLYPHAVQTLRAVEKAWEDTVAEPVPDKFRELLAKLK
jgi:hypothetical protein